MQHRYVGDRNDFIKYALLRRVRTALGKPSLGVNWYLTDPAKVDRNAELSDGQLIDYLLGDGTWRREADRELFDRLQHLLVRDGQLDDEARSLDTIEASSLLGENAIYFVREVTIGSIRGVAPPRTASDAVIEGVPPALPSPAARVRPPMPSIQKHRASREPEDLQVPVLALAQGEEGDRHGLTGPCDRRHNAEAEGNGCRGLAGPRHIAGGTSEPAIEKHDSQQHNRKHGNGKRDLRSLLQLSHRSPPGPSTPAGGATGPSP